ANADHRFSVRPSQFQETVQLLYYAISGFLNIVSRPPLALDTGLISQIINDLSSHRGASIVLVGGEASPFVHACAHALNDKLGNVGKTVFYTDPVEANSVDQTQSLRELVQDIDAGKVEMLVIIGGNPAYNTPADLRLNFERLKKINLRVHHGLYKDETAEICHWHVPATHYLESWSDTRAYDGTVTIVQPLIEPLYAGKSVHELLAVFSD